MVEYHDEWALAERRCRSEESTAKVGTTHLPTKTQEHPGRHSLTKWLKPEITPTRTTSLGGAPISKMSRVVYSTIGNRAEGRDNGLED